MTPRLPAAGEPAPEFSLPADDGAAVTLKDLRGRPVVRFFYPKDDTSGGTVEVCSFRDTLPKFHGLDAVVLGVSPDSIESHARFKKKYDLPYQLLADTDHAVAEAYGVWQEKSMFGRKYMGVARTTFVIDTDGRVARVFENVKPEDHGVEVAEAVAAL